MLLTPIDGVVPPVYSKKFFFFPESPKSDVSIVVDTFRQGLSKTLEAIPVLSGKVHVIDQRGALGVAGPWSTVDEIFQVKDLRREGRLDYRTLKDKQFPSGQLDPHILASLDTLGGGLGTEKITLPGGSGVKSERPVMFVQVNMVKGGIIMAMCMNHQFTDGNGIPVITRVWAAYCRGDDGSQLVTPEMLDRGRLMQGRGGVNLDEFPEFAKNLMRDKAPAGGFLASMSANILAYLNARLPPWLGGIGKPIRRVESKPATATFFFSKSKLAELKSMASAKLNGESENEWISTNDALSALVGCCMAAARDKEIRAKAERAWVISPVLSGRRVMNPPLPADYIGNFLVSNRISAPSPTVDSTPAKVAEMAHLIRGQIKQRDEAYFRGIIGALSSVQDLRRVQTVPISASEDMILITSWAGQNFYEINWGDGVGSRIERVRRVSLNFKYLCCILPELKAPNFADDECGLEIHLSGLDMDEVTRLKQNELFMRFAQWISDYVQLVATLMSTHLSHLALPYKVTSCSANNCNWAVTHNKFLVIDTLIHGQETLIAL